MSMNPKRAVLPLVVFVLLCLFAFLCAAAIAENEIIESYRWMVYLGVALALAAFALAFVGAYFFSLASVRKKAKKLSASSDGAERLGELLGKCRTPASRSAVSLELAAFYLASSRPDRARSVLMLIDPDRPVVFDRKLLNALLEKCGKQ